MSEASVLVPDPAGRAPCTLSALPLLRRCLPGCGPACFSGVSGATGASLTTGSCVALCLAARGFLGIDLGSSHGGNAHGMPAQQHVAWSPGTAHQLRPLSLGNAVELQPCRGEACG